MNALTFAFVAILIFWWHLVPWLIRLGLLRILPSLVGRILAEMRGKVGGS